MTIPFYCFGLRQTAQRIHTLSLGSASTGVWASHSTLVAD